MSDGPPDHSTRTVRVGIGLSPDLVRLERAQLLTLVARINRSDIDHVTVTDHVSFRGGSGQDALAALHYLAGLGIERELHTGVLILPLRHPTIAARQLLDLADVHPFGVVAGVGVGGDDPDEFAMVGLSTSARGVHMEHATALLLDLLGPQHPIDHDGVYAAAGPGLERGAGRRVEVLVGGRVGASFERAARASGWLAAFCSPSRFRAGGERVRNMNPQATVGYQAWMGAGPDGRAAADAQIRRFYGIDPAHFERYVPAGDLDALRDHFAAYVDAGADLITLFPAGDPAVGVDTVDALARSFP